MEETAQTMPDLAYNVIDPPNTSIAKSPVIFLHGMGASKENFDGNTKNLAQLTNRKMIAVDVRNHGDSSWTGQLDYDSCAVDLLHLMDQLHIPRAVLVGHSMGAVISFITALKAPDRVSAIISEDMPMEVPVKFQKLMAERFVLMRDFELNQPPDLSSPQQAKLVALQYIYDHGSEIMRKVVMPDGKPNGKPDLQRFSDMVANEDGSGYHFKANVSVILQGVQNQSLHRPYSGIYRGPVLMLFGARSPFDVFSHEKDIRKYFPAAEFVSIENAEHMIHYFYADDFAREVVNFLTRVD